MNLLNRFLVALLALATLGGSIIVLLVLFGAVDPGRLGIGAMAGVLAPIQGFGRTEGLVAAAACFVVACFSFVLLKLELTAWDRDDSTLTLKRSPMGVVSVARSSVRRLVELISCAEPGVLECRSRIREGRRGLRIESTISVDPQEQLPALTAGLQSRIKEGVEAHLGRAVAEVVVIAKIEPMRGGRSPAPRVR